MLKTVVIYGLALAAGAVALQWLEYQVWARTHPGTVYERAQTSLGITEREREVLKLLAEGRSNKEIARRLELSPNTVKTHVAHLFEKLRVVRRMEAIVLARELGLVP
jgi:DNA-binding CsgD family transcriptional regulator